MESGITEWRELDILDKTQLNVIILNSALKSHGNWVMVSFYLVSY